MRDEAYELRVPRQHITSVNDLQFTKVVLADNLPLLALSLL